MLQNIDEDAKTRRSALESSNTRMHCRYEMRRHMRTVGCLTGRNRSVSFYVRVVHHVNTESREVALWMTMC